LAIDWAIFSGEIEPCTNIFLGLRTFSMGN